jgi:hypothetical protein
VTSGRKRAGNALSPAQHSALVKLREGALPWINRAFGRKRACPSTWISSITASALVREGLATISVSGCGSWLRLTASGRHYAQTRAEAAETKAPVTVCEVSAQSGFQVTDGAAGAGPPYEGR